jgi:hypothetical protein
LSEIETVVGKAKAEIIHRELNKDAK